MFKFRLVSLVILISFSLTTFGESRTPLVKEIYQLYKEGDYNQAIEKIDKLIEYVGDWGMAHYLKGRAYSLMQDFDKANISFLKAYKSKVFPRTMFYEYAQSLYSANELKMARVFFRKAIKDGHNPDKGHYYYAYCSQLLEDYKTALKHYDLLIRAINVSVDLKQSANFLKGKILLEQAESSKDPAKFVQQKVLPEFEAARKLDLKSPLASEIYGEIYSIKKKYNLFYKDGSSIKKSPISLSFTQKFGYNSNLTYESDDTASSVGTKKTSPIAETDISLGYIFDFKRFWVVTLGLAGSYDKHYNDKVSAVRMNNLFSYSPSLKNSIKHKINGKAASANIDFNYVRKNKAHMSPYEDLKAYSNALSFTLAEKLSFFKAGDSSLSIKYKKLEGIDGATTDSTTLSLSLSQYLNLKDGKLFLFMLNMIDTETEPNKDSSTRSYLLINNYYGSEIFKGYKWEGSLGIMMTDTMANKSVRGTEMTYMPSLSLVKFNTFSSNFKNNLIFKYEFEKKSSDSSTYNYTQHIISLSLSISM